MKYFMCVEDGDKFHIEAESLEQAKEDVSVWNGEVVREMTPSEVKYLKELKE